MNLLFPFFMAGLFAVAIPILLHFRRQPPQKAVTFSSLMFLEQTPVPPRTRRKLEDWLLLALRCLALALLALMFARPYWRAGGMADAPGGTRWYVLLDTSASMARPGAWEALGERLKEGVSLMKEGDEVALATFDREPRELMDFASWQSLPPGSRQAELLNLARTVRPGWLSTDLGRALLHAAGRLQDQSGSWQGGKRVLVISDFQEGALLEALHTGSWPEDVTVTPMVVEAPWRDNMTLAAAAALVEEEATSVPASGSQAPAGDDAVRVRVMNVRESAKERFELKWQGSDEKVEGVVPAGGGRVVRVPGEAMAGDRELVLAGDALEFDNRLFVARPRPREMRVLCVGDQLSPQDTASPLFYLVRALQPTAGLKPVVVDRGFAQVSRADLPGTSLVFVFGEGRTDIGEWLEPWVRAGGAVVYVAGEGDTGRLLARLTGRQGLTLTESASRESLLQDLKFDHVMLRAFAEAGVRDFSKIRFWKHRKLALPEATQDGRQVLARFDDRSPAWVEWTLGEGRLLFWGAGWSGGESQMAVSSKFVPLLHGVLDWAAGGVSAGGEWVVGDAIPAAFGNWQGTVAVNRPDGKAVVWDAAAQPRFTATQLPGIYRFGSGEEARSVAVNLAASEGRVAPMEGARLAELGVKLAPSLTEVQAAELAAAQVKLAETEEEKKQKLWKAVLLAALVVLLIETWLAGRRSGAHPAPAAQPA